MYSQVYKRYALAILTTVYTLSFMDRVMIGMLMQPIKEDLLLSDTQLGFLTGIAFALFYSTMGIPIARWADRGNRVTIISIAMALWGGMVMLCFAVANFLQLVFVRIGAAVGEAGCMPPAYSLIGDYFKVNERARAFAVYMSGISISIVLSYIFAGWINDAFNWRVAFLIIGFPGLLMAVVTKITLREPRDAVKSRLSNDKFRRPYMQVITFLWRQRTFRYLVIALTLVNFIGIGLGQWLPSFYIRNHQMETTELGLWLGVVGGGSGIIGTLLGGYLIDRYFGNNFKQQLNVIAIGVAMLMPLYCCLLFMPYKQVALILMVPVNFLILFFYGPVMTLIQRLVEDNMRAMAIALTLLILNLVGMGLGPQAVGILSDMLMPTWGEAKGLQIALVLASIVSLGSAYYFWLAGKAIEGDMIGGEFRELSDIKGINNEMVSKI